MQGPGSPRLAHHSAAIEGNTLTLADTIILMVDERVPVAGTPVRELYEVANHYEALASTARARPAWLASSRSPSRTGPAAPRRDSPAALSPALSPRAPG